MYENTLKTPECDRKHNRHFAHGRRGGECAAGAKNADKKKGKEGKRKTLSAGTTPCAKPRIHNRTLRHTLAILRRVGLARTPPAVLISWYQIQGYWASQRRVPARARAGDRIRAAFSPLHPPRNNVPVRSVLRTVFGGVFLCVFVLFWQNNASGLFVCLLSRHQRRAGEHRHRRGVVPHSAHGGGGERCRRCRRQTARASGGFGGIHRRRQPQQLGRGAGTVPCESGGRRRGAAVRCE